MAARIAIFAQGSRGDVEPFLALAMMLKSRGHEVVLAAPDDFEGMIGRYGVAYASMGVSIEDLLPQDDTAFALRGNPFSIARLWRDVGVSMVEGGIDALEANGFDADVLIHHPKVMGVSDLAEATGALVVCASPIPIEATGDFPLVSISRDLGALNKVSWRALSGARALYKKSLTAWRESLGLGKTWKPRPGTDPVFGADMTFVAVSPTVMPKPSEWRGTSHVTGYWRIPNDTEWTPDAELAAFLANGPPPIYIGFGSMPVPVTLSETISGALIYASTRAVVSAGWGRLSVDSPHVLNIGSVPHDWLFRNVAGVMHHGGAGTTAAGLKAGRPTFVCPAGADQPFWGKRVRRLGCGPEPAPLKTATRDSLAAGIRATLRTARFAEAAETIGRRIHGEDGLTRAADLIEATLAARPTAR